MVKGTNSSHIKNFEDSFETFYSLYGSIRTESEFLKSKKGAEFVTCFLPIPNLENSYLK